MRITKFLLVAVVAGLFSINASAQKDHLAEANKTYEAGQYFEAITLMKKAYSKEKDKANKADIIYKTAECYRMVNQRWMGIKLPGLAPLLTYRRNLQPPHISTSKARL